MKFIKDIFLFVLDEIGCSKEDFIHAANQESKLESYFTLMYMICKLIITFTAIVGVLFSITMLSLLIIVQYPIILLPIFIIICLPYIAMLFFKRKGNKNENKN